MVGDQADMANVINYINHPDVINHPDDTSVVKITIYISN